MASPLDATTATDSPVRIVTQTRVEPDKTAAFARWHSQISAVIAAHPGFIKQTVMPPAPPGQVDWVILQRFANTEAALAWLRSDERQGLVAEAQPMFVGQDDCRLRFRR